MAEFVKVEGLQNVEKMLIALGPVMGFKALRMGLMAASKPLLLAAKSAAAGTGQKGFDSQAMAASMSRGVQKKGLHRTILWVGPRNKSKKGLAIYNTFHGTKLKRLNYFHLVEWGSVKMSPQPFMRPAFAATSRLVVSNLGNEIRKAIDKVKRKYAS